MMSLLSGLPANAVLKQLEALRRRLSIRYVDNTFLVLEKSKLGEFHGHLNARVLGIKFIREECKRTMPFLEVLVMSQADGDMQTTVCRKLTTTDRVLNYNLKHSKYHLRSCVRILFH